MSKEEVCQDARCRMKKHGVGDVVVVKREHVHPGQPTETQVKYRGAFTTYEVLASDTYGITTL